MNQGISIRGFVPVRSEPSHTSEMGSQLLFGESCRILQARGAWFLISLDFDGFEGWVARESLQALESGGGMEPESAGNSRMVVLPCVRATDLTRGEQVILPAGCIWRGTTGKSISIGGRHFELLSEEGVVIPGPGSDPEEIGGSLLSIPGLHGGRSGFGFDGPGLVQMLLRAMGIPVPRKSGQQAGMGTTLNFIHEIQKGDLAFFDNAEGEITHVGMVLGKGRILHAWDQVRIDKLDQNGIYCSEREDYTHNLRIIKRITDQS